jgi:hypothetical protein
MMLGIIIVGQTLDKSRGTNSCRANTPTSAEFHRDASGDAHATICLWDYDRAPPH